MSVKIRKGKESVSPQPMSQTRYVLDHGVCRLVNYMGSDLDIVRSARVSYNGVWRTGDDEGKDAKLIHYLMKNRHTTPFECVNFTFEIEAPIFVFRQWHRHRTWSYNEVSARYAELPELYYIPLGEQVGLQSKSRQRLPFSRHVYLRRVNRCQSFNGSDS
jgi:thymidylate synthase (FAD)